jgi:hypothetical protein
VQRKCQNEMRCTFKNFSTDPHKTKSNKRRSNSFADGTCQHVHNLRYALISCTVQNDEEIILSDFYNCWVKTNLFDDRPTTYDIRCRTNRYTFERTEFWWGYRRVTPTNEEH